jgi:hypothetical protein
MQPIPKPTFMQKPAHQQLRLGILAAYARHVIAAGFFAVYIGHKAKVREIKKAMPQKQLKDNLNQYASQQRQAGICTQTRKSGDTIVSLTKFCQ